MKLSLPIWFSRSKSAQPPTLAELRERLTQAEADLAASTAAVEAARERLDTDRTSAALTELRDARAREADLRDLVDLVRRDVAREEQAEAERERERLVARASELRAELDPLAIREAAAPLAKAEFAAALRLADLHAERHDLRDTVRRKSQELFNTRKQLGDDARFVDDSGRALHRHATREIIDAHVATLAADDPRREFLRQFGNLIAPDRGLPDLGG